MRFQVQYAETKDFGNFKTTAGQVWSTHKSLAMAKREVVWLKKHGGHKAIIVEVNEVTA